VGISENTTLSSLKLPTVFADPLSITVRDPDHSETEERFLIVGYSNRFRPLIVSHTDRGVPAARGSGFGDRERAQNGGLRSKRLACRCLKFNP